MGKKLQKPHRRAVRRGEALAIMSEALHSGPNAIWWDSYQCIPPNERNGAVACVYVRGSLDHHHEYGGDSYEAILGRVESAMCGEDEDDTKPNAVVLRIDSPGGVVAGLNECVFSLREMSKTYGVPLVAYVDELAASAAYAIACACDEIYLPPSAICGSVGVISTMFDQVDADKDMGVNFVTITSGARKSDGHPHVAVSKEAVAAEQRRVDKLAKQFFGIVATARGLSPKTVASYQAGIYLGTDAVDVGLADDVMALGELMDSLQDSTQSNSYTQPANGVSNSSTIRSRSSTMSLSSLKALVKRTTTLLGSEKDPKKRKILRSALSAYEASVEAYKKMKYVKEEETSEESEEDDEEESEEEESEAKGNETDRKESSDDDEDDEKDDEDDEEEAAAASASTHKALAALATQATGKKGRSAVGALAAMIEEGRRAASKVAAIEKERRAEKKSAAIATALSARRITKSEAKTLGSKPFSFVSSFLDMRPHAIVNTDEDGALTPSASGGSSRLSDSVMSSIEAALSSADSSMNKDALRKQMIEAHEKRMSAASNGAGRY